MIAGTRAKIGPVGKRPGIALASVDPAVAGKKTASIGTATPTPRARPIVYRVVGIKLRPDQRLVAQPQPQRIAIGTRISVAAKAPFPLSANGPSGGGKGPESACATQGPPMRKAAI